MKDVRRLVEAMAVVAVAAAIMGTVSLARRAVRLSDTGPRCIDNERKIGLALMRYADDYDGCFPPNRTTMASTDSVWKDALAPALRARPNDRSMANVFRCPGNPAAWARGPLGVEGDTTGRWPRSYAYNSAPLLRPDRPMPVGPLRKSDFPAPAQCMMVLETRNAAPDIGPWMVDGIAAPDGTWSNRTVVYWDQNTASNLGAFHHHNKLINAIMADGHVASVTLSQTCRAPQMWTPFRPANAYEGKIAGMLPEYATETTKTAPRLADPRAAASPARPE